jgi:non-ribosomal peptide synthetase component F
VVSGFSLSVVESAVGALIGSNTVDLSGPSLSFADASASFCFVFFSFLFSSWGTLSFTSGSTGLPKGVQGRHFALSHYYPFMGRRFGLNENDRFTMLSGQYKIKNQKDFFGVAWRD